VTVRSELLDLADSELRREFEAELLVGEATAIVAALLESSGITQKAIAERLGVTPGRVSQILSGEANLTLRSLADLAWALGMRFELVAQPADRAGTPAVDDPPLPDWIGQLAGDAAPEHAR
jgi:transcriptional regulator with XRE-family HTH domain